MLLNITPQLANVAETIGGWYPALRVVYAVIGTVFSAMLAYKVI